MAGDNNKIPDDEAVIGVTVTMDTAGRINVQSNGQNKVIMAGMLELAKALILNEKSKEPSPIVVARAGLAG